jgi:hypothetical protein
VPIIDGAPDIVNLTVPQQQLPLSILFSFHMKERLYIKSVCQASDRLGTHVSNGGEVISCGGYGFFEG